MFITSWCFSCCWTVLTVGQGLLGFSYCPASEEAGGARGRGHRTPPDPRDIPYCMTPYSELQSWGRKEEAGCVWSYGIGLSKSPLGVMQPSFPGGGQAPACRWEAVNGFLVLLCVHAKTFTFPIQLSLSQTKSFTVLILCPHPTGEAARGCMRLRCQLG